MLTVEFTVLGVPRLGLQGGPAFGHGEAFLFQVATDDRAETDRCRGAVVADGAQGGACGWCKDKWCLPWQITPRVPTGAMAGGCEVAELVRAMVRMRKIAFAAIEAAVRG